MVGVGDMSDHTPVVTFLKDPTISALHLGLGLLAGITRLQPTEVLAVPVATAWIIPLIRFSVFKSKFCLIELALRAVFRDGGPTRVLLASIEIS